MDWIKQFFSTDRLQLKSELSETQKHNRQLQKLLAESIKDSNARESKLIECLDRVIMSRFDPPLMPHPEEQPNNGMNLPHEHLSDVLSVEDDTEFLEKTDA